MVEKLTVDGRDTKGDADVRLKGFDTDDEVVLMVEFDSTQWAHTPPTCLGMRLVAVEVNRDSIVVERISREEVYGIPDETICFGLRSRCPSSSPPSQFSFVLVCRCGGDVCMKSVRREDGQTMFTTKAKIDL